MCVWHCRSRSVWAAFCLETLPSTDISSTIYRYLWRFVWVMKVHVPWYARRFRFVSFLFFFFRAAHRTKHIHTHDTSIDHFFHEQTAPHITCELLCPIVAICFFFHLVCSLHIFQIWIVVLVEWSRQTPVYYGRLWLCHSIFRFQLICLQFFFIRFSSLQNSRRQSELAEVNRQKNRIGKMITWFERLNIVKLEWAFSNRKWRDHSI